MTSPSLYGQPAPTSATIPAASAAATDGRSVSAGTSSAMKVSARVKSSAQLGGTCAPTKIPTAVLTCHTLQSASPAGYGETHIVAAGEELGYTVYFENMPAATPPVQELVIEDALDPDLDWATLELGEVAYGGRIVAAPPGTLEFTAQDFPGAADIAGTFQGQARVDITAALDPDAGKITCCAKVIDTATCLPPEDADAGFLPPENGTGRGQGHVTFTIRPSRASRIGRRSPTAPASCSTPTTRSPPTR